MWEGIVIVNDFDILITLEVSWMFRPFAGNIVNNLKNELINAFIEPEEDNKENIHINLPHNNSLKVKTPIKKRSPHSKCTLINYHLIVIRITNAISCQKNRAQCQPHYLYKTTVNNESQSTAVL